MSLTGNAAADYSHVWITAQAVWFNTSATAGPDDSGWAKFNLSTPTTIDLVADNGGTLGTLATSLKVLPGSYSQVRLIPVDPSLPLTASAQAAGALSNAEVDYEDSGGNTVQAPLELLNAEQGIGIQTALKVPVGNVGGGLAAGSSTTSGFGTTGTNDATGSNGLFDASGGTNQSTTASTTGTTGTTTTTTASFAINLNGTDLVPFSYGLSSTNKPLATGILLSQHAAAYDLAEVGGIQGQLTLTDLTNFTGASGLPDLIASAEVLSADGSRHVVVASTPVRSDGSFLIYPLPTNSSSPAVYDVVIHGAGMATIIIKSVTVTLSTSSATTATPQSTTNTTDTTTNTQTTDTSTTTTTATSTYSSIITPTVNAVSLGTLIPRAATTYSAKITTVAGAPLPAGSLVSFYETPTGEVPYVIESSPLDPFNQVLGNSQLLSLGLNAPGANAQVLSSGTIDTGTYVASGNTITLVSGAPAEGAGQYLAAASAPAYADGNFSGKVAPPTGSATSPVTVAIPSLSLASGGATGSVIAAVTPPASPNTTYDQGQLIIAHEGTVVATVALDGVLSPGGGNVTASVPAGTPAALYYVSVRVWNTRNASGTLKRQSYPTAVDLRSSTSGSIALTIN
jgi:hypothetical protein